MARTELLQLTEREPAGVNIHLSDANEPQRGREPEPGSDRALEQQVRQLVLLFQAKRGVVEHPTVQVTRLIDLQLADVALEPHQLPGQLLVLQAHVCLRKRNKGHRLLAEGIGRHLWVLSHKASQLWVKRAEQNTHKLCMSS